MTGCWTTSTLEIDDLVLVSSGWCHARLIDPSFAITTWAGESIE